MSRTLGEIQADLKRLYQEQAMLRGGCEHKRRKGEVLFGNQYTQICRDCGEVLEAYAGAIGDPKTGEWEEDDPWPKDRETTAKSFRRLFQK